MLLAFDDDGPGPVVVLLHAFATDHTLWAAQRAEVGLIYRLIVPDLRGHGRSAAPAGVYSIDDMADDVMETLDALQLRAPVVVGGVSMGGYVALSAVARYPDRFRALMLFDTKAAADSAEAAATREDLAREVEASGSVAKVVEEMVPRLFAASSLESQPKLVARVRAVMLKTSPVAVVGSLRGMAARPDRRGDLAKVDMPALVVVGAEDALTPPEEARSMAEALPRGRLVVVPGAGHLSPAEEPAACNRAALEFLNAHS